MQHVSKAEMKCDSCVHFWHYPADASSPYGEFACMKDQVDLYDAEPQDVENCVHYEEAKA